MERGVQRPCATRPRNTLYSPMQSLHSRSPWNRKLQTSVNHANVSMFHIYALACKRRQVRKTNLGGFSNYTSWTRVPRKDNLIALNVALLWTQFKNARKCKTRPPVGSRNRYGCGDKPNDAVTPLHPAHGENQRLNCKSKSAKRVCHANAPVPYPWCSPAHQNLRVTLRARHHQLLSKEPGLGPGS